MGLIIFDGNCIVCNSFIQWLNKRNSYFLYANLSDLESLNSHLKSKMVNLNQVIVFDKGNIFYGADAIEYIIQTIYPDSLILKFIRILPTIAVSKSYNIVAKNRMMFGPKNYCKIDHSISSKIVTVANIASHIHSLL